jgi:UDP-glucose 4-epimerase
MKILVSGGAGYIGSTICSALEDSGYTPIIIDSLVTGKVEFVKNRTFYHGDIADYKILEKIFFEHPDIEYAIHCAALIVVPDSITNPYEYYRENVSKSNEFFKQLLNFGCKKLVFSSSASIYDTPPDFVVTEKSFIKPCSPYAKSKFMMELILQDFCLAYFGMKAISLRYFNPIGADPKMRSGNHHSNPSHVLAKLINTALGHETEFNITGVNWPTRDGSGIRDYIHVWDLAEAHVKAIENFDTIFVKQKNPYCVINLGTGKGVTVKELLSAFESIYGKTIPTKETDPRPGDIAGSYANADLAHKLLDWKAKFEIEKGIYDALKWNKEKNNIFKSN